jgi:chitosanase
LRIDGPADPPIRQGRKSRVLTDLQKRTAEAIVNVFETGRARGDYAKVTVIPGDPGHLTYGRAQTTLASGNLHLLVKAYCETAGATLAAALRRHLPKLATRDESLDRDLRLRRLLEDAGADAVMREVQDAFFDRVYWHPSASAAVALGIVSPLGANVVYDSHIHGSWLRIRDRTDQRHGPVSRIGERAWIAHYVAERREWLATHSITVLHLTVYRMDTFASLIREAAWDLPLPLRIRGVTIDQDTLVDPVPTRVSAQDPRERTLLVQRPPLKGPDVTAVQRALVAAEFRTTVDGRYGKRTATAVRAFQRSKDLVADGITGPATRAALGL